MSCIDDRTPAQGVLVRALGELTSRLRELDFEIRRACSAASGVDNAIPSFNEDLLEAAIACDDAGWSVEHFSAATTVLDRADDLLEALASFEALP